jgi:formamidopyrimidine-DNA glycosylase
MPELPEVEAVARSLRPLVAGKEILRCEVFHAIAVRPQRPGRVRRRTEGGRVEEVSRRGKYLLLHLRDGCIVMHFRLDGQLVWFDPGRLAGHVDVALHFPDGALGFVDRRHFGRLHWFRSAEEVPAIRALGVDPLSPDFSAPSFRALLLRSRRPVKLFLMDQARIAGLGNIYANEALWRARVDPRRRTHRLAPEDARRLHKAVVDVLSRALECCLAPAPDLRNPEWWFAGLEGILRVYDREGQPCARCRNRIRRIEQGGRSSYFCPGCQR